MGRLLAVVAVILLPLSGQDDYRAERERMVSRQIEARGISDAGVLRVMRTTPRHEFVPERLRGQAYEDHPLPIGHGQTISQPYIVALMTQTLDASSSDRVLEIGTGSGYQAAVLSPLVKHLYTIEIIPELAAAARQRLARYENVSVRQGDGYRGWPEEAPFDRVILTAAPPEIPAALLSQLAPGGKLLAPVGGSPWTQKLVLVTRDAKGKLHRKSILPVVFVPMVHGK